MNLNERLIQCRKDKEAIEEQEKEILEQMKPKKLEFGDIVSCDFGMRIMLYEEKDKLAAFSKRGENVGNNCPSFYTKIRNIFDENSSVLDN